MSLPANAIQQSLKRNCWLLQGPRDWHLAKMLPCREPRPSFEISRFSANVLGFFQDHRETMGEAVLETVGRALRQHVTAEDIFAVKQTVPCKPGHPQAPGALQHSRSFAVSLAPYFPDTCWHSGPADVRRDRMSSIHRMPAHHYETTHSRRC
jgi:hypothetical protein